MNEKRFLKNDEAAEILRISANTLNKWRCRGLGPPYLKFNGTIRYDIDSLLKWANSQTVKTVETP